MENKMSLRDYYNVLVYTCELCEEEPENDTAIAMFADAAVKLAHAKCSYLFPDDVYPDDELGDNASSSPDEGKIVTGVIDKGEEK